MSSQVRTLKNVKWGARLGENPAPASFPDAGASAMRGSRIALQSEYVTSVRSHLPVELLKALVDAASDLWPGFNRRSLRPGSALELKRMAERLGVNLKMQPLRERGSAALHGFYVGASPEGLRKALIFLNTAHHPLAVATAFCHEVGHHLASGMFNHRAAGIELMMNGEFSEHLSNPVELAADIVVSLAAYPAPVARRLFANKCRAGGTQQRDPLTIPVLAGVENHLNRSYRYAHASGRPVMWSDRYAAGILHYAALRWALLSERDI